MALAPTPNRSQPFTIHPQPKPAYHFKVRLRTKVLGIIAVAMLTAIIAAPRVLAATSDDATAKAVSIAAAIIVVAPLVLPFLLKLVPASGQWMNAIAYGVSLVVAVVAAISSGLVHATDFSTVPGVLAVSLAVYGLMQLVYNIFKAHSTFQKLVV